MLSCESGNRAYALSSFLNYLAHFCSFGRVDEPIGGCPRDDRERESVGRRPTFGACADPAWSMMVAPMPGGLDLGAPEIGSSLLVNPGGTIVLCNDDWLWLAQSGVCLVDKSLLMRDFYECHSKVALVLRPRQFGKTLALNMLCTFFDFEYYWRPFGPVVSSQVVSEPVSRERRLEIFRKTRLGRQFPEFVETHCARYPVLFVSFRVRISR